MFFFFKIRFDALSISRANSGIPSSSFPSLESGNQDLVPFLWRFAVCQLTVLYGLDGFLNKEICWWDNPKKVGVIMPHVAMALALVSLCVRFFHYSLKDD